MDTRLQECLNKHGWDGKNFPNGNILHDPVLLAEDIKDKYPALAEQRGVKRKTPSDEDPRDPTNESESAVPSGLKFAITLKGVEAIPSPNQGRLRKRCRLMVCALILMDEDVMVLTLMV